MSKIKIQSSRKMAFSQKNPVEVASPATRPK